MCFGIGSRGITLSGALHDYELSERLADAAWAWLHLLAGQEALSSIQ
jgi:hypothetical protein